eukprot:6191238-Pleurochrysis_carterae.AAC.2
MDQLTGHASLRHASRMARSACTVWNASPPLHPSLPRRRRLPPHTRRFAECAAAEGCRAHAHAGCARSPCRRSPRRLAGRVATKSPPSRRRTG